MTDKEIGMPVTIKGTATLHGLQHAEINTVLAYFNNFKAGVFTIVSYAKATAAAALIAGVTGAAITVLYKGPGKGMGGSETFGVPGPEVGAGLSFAVAASLLGLFFYYRSKRSSAM
jgi:hypothetical protein